MDGYPLLGVLQPRSIEPVGAVADSPGWRSGADRENEIGAGRLACSTAKHRHCPTLRMGNRDALERRRSLAGIQGVVIGEYFVLESACRIDYKRSRLVMVVKLTANEWQILRIVWELKSCGARKVCVIAKDQFGWAPTTVKTYLKLLVEKGRLSTEKRGNRFLDRPTASARIGLREAADTFLEKVVGGAESSLLAYMIRKSDLTPNDIRELRQSLACMQAGGPAKGCSRAVSISGATATFSIGRALVGWRGST